MMVQGFDVGIEVFERMKMKMNMKMKVERK